MCPICGRFMSYPRGREVRGWLAVVGVIVTMVLMWGGVLLSAVVQ